MPQGENKAETHGIVSRAFAETAALVCHGAPNAYPSGDPDEDDGEFVASLQDLAESLLQVLEVLFPEPAEQHGDNDGTVKSEGWRTFMLWQSRVDRFKPPDLHDNFDPDHVGRGSAGAMRALGLGDDHVNPAPADDESEAYFNGIVEEMRIGLVPGAVLQFWTLNSDFKKVSAREGGLADSGHSPLFLGYRQNESGTVTGLRLLDQTGESDNPMSVQGGNRRLTWNNAARAIWIAANWLE